MWIFLNDRWVSQERAKVSVFDHGFLYGDGVFETLRARKGVILSLTRHLERLHRSAAGISLSVPAIAWESLLKRALKKNSLREALVRITLTRGPGPASPSVRACLDPTLVIFARPFRGHPRSFYLRGVSAVLAKTRRNFKKALDPEIKSGNLLNSILAYREAEVAGAQEAILLNTRGSLTEGSVSNLFFLRGGVLFTPSLKAGILPGITRERVLALARQQGMATKEGSFSSWLLRSADEAFLTSTSWEIVPLTFLDGNPIGSGRPGKTTRRLIALFQESVRQEVNATSTARLNSAMVNGRSKGTRPDR